MTSIACRKFQPCIRMRIKSIRHSGFRVYGDGVEILPCQKVNQTLHFVGGQNGYGKSTFITSLLWCLYGKLISHVDEPFMRMIRLAGGYDAFLEQSLNKYSANDGFFVEIVFQGVELPALSCKELMVRRAVKGTNESLEILIDGQTNELVDSVGYELFIQEYILPKEVARFFMFDAERITNLAESRGARERRELGNAYEKVLGVKKYLEISEQLAIMQERTLAMETSPEIVKELDRLEKTSDKLSNEIVKQEEEIERCTELLGNLKQEREELSLNLFSHGHMGDVTDLNNLKEEEARLKLAISETSASLKSKMNAVPFMFASKSLSLLTSTVGDSHSSISDYDLVRIQSEIKKWSEDVGVQQKDSRKLILKIMDLLVGDGSGEESSFNASDIAKLKDLNDQLSWLRPWMATTLSQLKRDRAALHRLKSKLNKLNRSGSNEEVGFLREQIEELDRKIEEAIGSKRAAEIQIGDLTKELGTIAKRRSELLKNIEVSERSAKKVDVLASVKEKLETFVESFKEKRRQNLERRISEALRKMFHKDLLIDSVSITIDESGMDLNLLDPEGRVVPKESLSMGEKQLYAVALLKALIDESGMDFPVVVDSPLQKLDPDHAIMLLDQVFPELASQVFVLPLPNKELTLQEFEKIERHVGSLHLIVHDQGRSSVKACDKSEFFKEEVRIKELVN